MKTCTKCHEKQFETNFFMRDKTTGRLHAQCKSCYSAHRKTYYMAHYEHYKQSYLERAKLRREKLRLEFRQNMLEYLSDKTCVICGEADIRVLELDHIDPHTKNFGISKAVSLGYGWNEVLNELKKCQILCANCHKKRTAQQFNWYKAL